MGFDLFLGVLGGLGIFLFGMHHMSKGMQKIAGPRLKSVIGLLTKNRVIACIVGIGVTGMVQSSSVSTVMTIGFINASLMSLKQGLGVILGANIGTTITGWILILKIGKYGLPIAGAAAFFFLFSKKDKVKTKALTIMGLGLVFFGLELMSEAFKPLRTMPEFIKLFHSFDASSGFLGVLAAALVGALVTSIVQSSSATLGITIVLASQGMISSETAVALVLGENVGTTITAMLASIGTVANARRAAMAHAIINVIGVTWVILIFPYYLTFLHTLVDPGKNIAEFIATAHTIFNISNAIIFLPLIGYLAKFLENVISNDEAVKEERETSLDLIMLETPALVVDQMIIELDRNGKKILEGFDKVGRLISEGVSGDSKEVDEVVELEESMDLVQKEMIEVGSKLLVLDLDRKTIKKVRKYIAIIDQYESITDYLMRIVKVYSKVYGSEASDNHESFKGAEKIHNKTRALFEKIYQNGMLGNGNALLESAKESVEISQLYKKLRGEHLDLVESEKKSSIYITGYMDMLNHYRRLSDHSLTIVEVLEM